MRYCPHCLKQNDSGEFCVHCGKKITIEKDNGSGQLPVGTLLNKLGGTSYQLGAVLGQGGFGITYAAKNLVTGERVAVKEYYPSHCAVRSRTCRLTSMTGQEDSYYKGMKGFLEEAKMLSSVGSLPCVVSVMDYFEANGTAYLVMEYVEGSALSSLMKKKGAMRASALLPMLLPLMQDLEIIHRAGIIHRDISPDNLILMPNGKLKLLDFGSARSTQGDRTMTMLLKAGFSPIEQYQSHGQGTWTDVYALCATIYYCLTGTIPPVSVDRLTEDTIVLPNAMGAGLSPAQQAALMHGLQVLKPNRTPTIQDLRRELFMTQPQPAPNFGRPPAPKPAPAPVPRPAPAPVPGPVPVPPERKNEGKPKTLVILLICLSAVLVIILGIIGAALLSDNTGSGKRTGSRVKDKTGTYKEYGYTIEDGSCTITDYTGSETKLEIPDTIEGAPVERISANAFAGNTDLTRVDFPDGVTIESDAFNGCTTIDYLVIGNDCVLEADAFAACTGLEAVNVLADCSIDQNAFSGCDSLCAATYVGNDPFSNMTFRLPFFAYEDNMDVGVGKLAGVDVLDHVIYGETYDGDWVVMDIPDDTREITLNDSAVWVYKDALDGVSTNVKIHVGEETLFDFAISDKADWQTKENSLSAAWLLTCSMCRRINNDGSQSAEPKPELARIAWQSVAVIAQDNIVDDDAELEVMNEVREELGCTVNGAYGDAQFFYYSDYASQDAAFEAIVDELDASAEQLAEERTIDSFAVSVYFEGDELAVLCWVAETA